MKRKTFFFHYNKPASKAQRRNVLTLHWAGACHLVHVIKCVVPVETRARKSRPRCIIAGKAFRVWLHTSSYEEGFDQPTVTAQIL